MLKIGSPLVGQVTPTMLKKIGFGTFIFFGVFSLMGGFFIMFFFPETKGLTLEEMDKAFGDEQGLSIVDQQRHAEISRRIGLEAYLNTRSDRMDDKSGEKAEIYH
jgi:hypothetical protein